MVPTRGEVTENETLQAGRKSPHVSGTATSTQRNSKMEASDRATLNEAPGLLQERTYRAEFSNRRCSDDSSSRSHTCALYCWRHVRRTATAAKMSAHRASAVHNQFRQSRLWGPSLRLPLQWSSRCEECAPFRARLPQSGEGQREALRMRSS